MARKRARQSSQTRTNAASAMRTIIAAILLTNQRPTPRARMRTKAIKPSALAGLMPSVFIAVTLFLPSLSFSGLPSGPSFLSSAGVSGMRAKTDPPFTPAASAPGGTALPEFAGPLLLSIAISRPSHLFAPAPRSEPRHDCCVSHTLPLLYPITGLERNTQQAMPVTRGARMELTGRSWIMGLTLRLLREAAGLKAREVTAKYLQCSTTRLFSIEGGYRKVNALELSGLVTDAYRRPDLLPILEPLRACIADGGTGPIHDPIAKHPNTSLYEELENMSTQILNTVIDTVPGLCQNEDYTYGQYSMEGNNHETAQRYAIARANRQDKLLARNPMPSVDLLITESAIHRASYVRGQLGRLAKRARHPNITLRYIPNSIGPHLTACNFTLLEFDGLPTVLSTHVIAGGGLIGDQEEVELALTRRSQLLENARSPEETLSLIEGTTEH